MRAVLTASARALRRQAVINFVIGSVLTTAVLRVVFMTVLRVVLQQAELTVVGVGDGDFFLGLGFWDRRRGCG